MPSICKLELVWPGYSLCKITVSSYEMRFLHEALQFIIVTILVCAIMPGFCKLGHILC